MSLVRALPFERQYVYLNHLCRAGRFGARKSSYDSTSSVFKNWIYFLSKAGFPAGGKLLAYNIEFLQDRGKVRLAGNDSDC